MITLPIGTYFATVHTVFKGKFVPWKCACLLMLETGNSTWAGALAAIMANVVLISYIFVAMAEDQSDQLAEKEKEKKKS